MFKHTGLKPFSCPFCKHCSALKFNLIRHIKNKHADLIALGMVPEQQMQQQSAHLFHHQPSKDESSTSKTTCKYPEAIRHVSSNTVSPQLKELSAYTKQCLEQLSSNNIIISDNIGSNSNSTHLQPSLQDQHHMPTDTNISTPSLPQHSLSSPQLCYLSETGSGVSSISEAHSSSKDLRQLYQREEISNATNNASSVEVDDIDSNSLPSFPSTMNITE